MIDDGAVVIRDDAKLDARRDFGWRDPDIMDALKKLQPRDFYKSDTSVVKPLTVLDFYKARVNGENVYVHFYIDDGLKKLVINSFHKV